MTLTEKEKEMLLNRLRGEMNRLGYKDQKDFAAFLGIRPSYLSMIFSGQRTGERMLKIFSQKLKKPVEWLLGRTVVIPLIAEISAGIPFEMQEAIIKMEVIDISEIPGIDPQKAKNLYALRIKDNSFFPALVQGEILIVDRSPNPSLQQGSRVVYPNGKTGCHMRYIEIGGTSVNLRCYNPTVSPITIPLEAARKLHKVISIIPA